MVGYISTVQCFLPDQTTVERECCPLSASLSFTNLDVDLSEKLGLTVKSLLDAVHGRITPGRPRADLEISPLECGG